MPALTKINSPTGSQTTNSVSKSPDYDSIRTGPEVWSFEDSLSCSQHEDLLQVFLIPASNCPKINMILFEES